MIGPLLTEVTATIRAIEGLSGEKPNGPVGELYSNTLTTFVYGGNGIWTYMTHGRGAAPTRNGNHNLYIECHCPLTDLATNMEALMAAEALIPDALIERWEQDKFGGSAYHFISLTYELRPTEWGSTPTLSWRFILNVESEV